MTSTNLVLLRRVALCADEDPDDARVAIAGGSVQGGVAVLEEKIFELFHFNFMIFDWEIKVCVILEYLGDYVF